MIIKNEQEKAENHAKGTRQIPQETEIGKIETIDLPVKQKSNILLLTTILILSLLISCSKGEEFYFYNHIQRGKWYTDSVQTFQIDSIPFNPKVEYTMSLELSITGLYPYRNIWLSLEHNFTDIDFRTDTVEYQLANEYGQWHGSGVGGINQISLPFLSNLYLDSTKSYKLNITQLMIDNPLEGVEKIGFKIE